MLQIAPLLGLAKAQRHYRTKCISFIHKTKRLRENLTIKIALDINLVLKGLINGLFWPTNLAKLNKLQKLFF